jgi:NAD(P)H dehydrogenase (quinone)
MRVLIVYAHPNPESFNHAILTKGLAQGGHSADVVGLYGIGFDPNVGLEDFVQFSGGRLPAEVVAQQEKVARADGIAVIHPMWGWSFPAILKGWMDRVFSFGFAYTASEEGIQGLLDERKTLVISTTGLPAGYYQTMGYMDAFVTMTNGIFNVCGITSIEYACFYGVQAAGSRQQAAGSRQQAKKAERLT